MALTFLQLAEKALLEAGKPLSAADLWLFITQKGYDKELNSQGKTPWSTLGARLYMDIRDNNASIFVAKKENGSRTTLFSLKMNPSSACSTPSVISNRPARGIKTPEMAKTPETLYEKDLHRLLVYFCHHQSRRVHMRTINHSKSEKKSYGEWVHPDLIGCAYAFEQREKLTSSICEVIGQSSISLFSFELKRRLTENNLRESFFQAVSNSSWANEGYLVAADITKENGFRKELERLSRAFGIGVIELDTKEPDNSLVLFSAHSKSALNLDSLDKLISMMNEDVTDLFKSITRSKVTQHTHKDDYDPVFEREALLKFFKDKA